jgi:hypothetical protein
MVGVALLLEFSLCAYKLSILRHPTGERVHTLVVIDPAGSLFEHMKVI